MKRTTLSAAVLLLSAAAANADFFSAGRPVPENRDSKWSLSAGALFGLEGTVDETFRAYYKATGQDSKQALAESYSLSDFGVDGAYPAFGLHHENLGKYFSFRWDVLYLSLETDATARRDYYLGLGDDVSWNGRDYDHLVIPSGSDFSIAFDGLWATVACAFTPFTMNFGETVRLSPELSVGLTVIGGEYEVDAGNPRGTTVYQNPPVEFVVGGRSSSLIGAGAPMVGAGLELRIGPDDGIQWITRAGAGYFTFSGSTKPFTSSSHREKDIDLDYFSVSVDTSLVFPVGEQTCLTLGVRAEYLDLDAEIKSKERDVAKIVAAHERFDKAADFESFSAMVYAGLTF